jgi:hypothetical protein
MKPTHQVTIPSDRTAFYPAFPDGVSIRECFHSRPAKTTPNPYLSMKSSISKCQTPFNGAIFPLL